MPDSGTDAVRRDGTARSLLQMGRVPTLKLIGQIQIQRATEEYVHYLHTATNAERGDVIAVRVAQNEALHLLEAVEQRKNRFIDR